MRRLRLAGTQLLGGNGRFTGFSWMTVGSCHRQIARPEVRLWIEWGEQWWVGDQLLYAWGWNYKQPNLVLYSAFVGVLLYEEDFFSTPKVFVWISRHVHRCSHRCNDSSLNYLFVGQCHGYQCRPLNESTMRTAWSGADLPFLLACGGQSVCVVKQTIKMAWLIAWVPPGRHGRSRNQVGISNLMTWT